MENVNTIDIKKKYLYLVHFVTRAFLYAVLFVMVLSFFVLAIYFGDLYLNVKNGNYKNPLFNGYVIVSESMVPTINVNDAIIVKRNNLSDYNVGDIISFESNDTRYKGLTVTHRIVEKNRKDNNNYYITKGDNNIRVDNTVVFSDNVYGKVMFKIPKIGYLQSFLSKPFNMIVCLVVPIFIVIIFDMYKIFNVLKSRERIN